MFLYIVSDVVVDKSIKDVLIVFCKFYVIDGIIENLGEFIEVYVNREFFYNCKI